MPQHPTARNPAPNAPTRNTDQPTQVAQSTQPTLTEPKAADLSINKVLAGAGAAATTAILGSYFGAAGTVTGAAFGSVASTLATTLYQRSLDRTRDTLVARVRPTGGRRQDVASGPTAELTVPMPRVSPEGATTRLRVEPAPRPRRRIGRWVGATALVFVLGLLAVTGIEWAKGSALTSGDSGTSVGRVLDGGRGNSGGAAKDTESTPTSEPSSSADPSTERKTEAPTPTTAPESTGSPTTAPRETGSAPSTNDGGAGRSQVQETPLVPVPLSPGE
jgi:hypothetical protein